MSRVLGLDYGHRRIGVAVSDPSGTIAGPFRVVDGRGRAAINEIVAICRDLDVGTIVIGLPVSLSGEEGPSAAAAREFGERVAASSGIDVVFHDERYTSVMAERVLLESGMRRRGRRASRDKVAATVMLQSFLDGAR